MANAPKPSDITNVFALHDPKHMFNKLAWDLQRFMEAGNVWTDNHGQPAAIYAAYDTVVTAWHISDWLWHSSPEVRSKLKARFKLQFEEGTKNQLNVGLKRFQDAIAEECRALAICREIAKGSKHMRTGTSDPDIKAQVEWLPIESQTSNVAISKARSLAAKNVGAIAFSRTGDPNVGEFNDAKVLWQGGEVPADLL
jgi:hypothetical protein